MRSSVVALLAFCTACGNLPREPQNPFVIERPWGLASGSSEAEALILAEAVEEVRPFFEQTWGFADRPLRIHFAPGPLMGGAAGITAHTDGGDAWVVVETGAQHLGFLVAHELGHFYLAPVLDPLPAVVEEGFCEMLASRVRPVPDAKQWRLISSGVSFLDLFTIHVVGPQAKGMLQYLVREVPPIEEALGVEEAELLRTEARTREAYYGLGWVIAEALDLEGLAELEVRRQAAGLDHVPVEWILDRAGLLPLTQESLRAAFGTAIGEPPDGPFVITLTDGDAPSPETAGE